MPSSIITINDVGDIGVKSINDSNRVIFHPISIKDSNTKGVFVSGLPDKLRLIKRGQGGVSIGDIVNPVMETE